MVVKSLDDIVLDAEVRERIRPYFEQATASGEADFEHDWQWNVYCDLLRAVTSIHVELKRSIDEINATRKKMSILTPAEKSEIAYATGWPVESRELTQVNVDAFVSLICLCLPIIIVSAINF